MGRTIRNVLVIWAPATDQSSGPLSPSSYSLGQGYPIRLLTRVHLLNWQAGSLLLVPPGKPRVALNNTNVSYNSGGQKSEMSLQDKIKESAELHYFGSSRNLFFALSSFWRCPRYLAHITLTSASIIHLFLWLRPCCLPLLRADYIGPPGQCRTFSPSQDPYLSGIFKAPLSYKVTYSQVLGSGRRHICRERYWPIRCINSLASNLLRSVLLSHLVDKDTEKQ